MNLLVPQEEKRVTKLHLFRLWASPRFWGNIDRLPYNVVP